MGYNRIGKFRLMEKVTLPNMERGPWKVEQFTTDRLCWNSALSGRPVPVGETFTCLVYKRQTIMSDTPAEMRDHACAVHRASGHCLIHGLGLGMVLKNILLKPEVTAMTVIEIDQDLIDMVAPHYADPRVTVICADALAWKPPKGVRYNMIWSDIWAGICSDNLKDMTVLRRRFGRRCDWHGCWCDAECWRQRRQEQRQEKENAYWDAAFNGYKRLEHAIETA